MLHRDAPVHATRDSVSSDAVVALSFAIPRGRASPTDFATAVAAVMVVPFAQVQDVPSSPEDTTCSDSVVAITSCQRLDVRQTSP